ncbi:MAG: LysM peptidoglycan-binding domain-containing protein [Cyclobacteriaceae bacterium]|nr:LysM peptidoglycan-binding domain-containing protein [Cyclobacteriaceae bacterium]
MKSLNYCIFLFLTFFVGAQELLAQIPQVPLEMEFADLTLRIHPQAQREIQLDVDALYRNPNYFKLKQERASLYLPLVEREFKNQGIPSALKYLAIQESGLVPDAISTSNAVGFWQFKQGTAEEVGLRVDSQIDERKSITASSRGAALYLKKHQGVLNNWMTALVSYQMGLGGAKAYFGTQYSGKKVVDIDRNTHWYFKKFLAHKVAYEAPLGQFASSSSRLIEVQIQGPASMAQLAKQYGVSEQHLLDFNKWAIHGKIPSGTFTLFYIKEGMGPVLQQSTPQAAPSLASTAPSTSSSTPAYKRADSFPRISGNTTKSSQPHQIQVNELEGVQAPETASTSKFSEEIGMKERKFVKVNDMEAQEQVVQGAYYYTQKKRPSAAIDTHIVEPGETLWSISQKYGIRLFSLKSKNKIRKDADLKPGMVLNLREPRRRGEEIPILRLTEPDPEPSSSFVSAPVLEKPVSEPEVVEDKSSPLPLYHTVSAGETLFSISKKYGLTVEQLKSQNGIGSQNLITVGQKLRILKP